MSINTAIALCISSIFLGSGIAAAGGADEGTVGTIALFGFLIAVMLVPRLERK